MLDLLAFDLDGTLADTEVLKAESYAWAARHLRPGVEHAAVVDAYTATCVGRSREEIARSLLYRFGLEDAARRHDGGVAPWESYVGLRLERYRAVLADQDLVRRRARPAAGLVARAREAARAVALVTTSDRRNTDLVLGALGLAGAFDAVVTADDVARTKPSPEGYRLALAQTGSEGARSLAVEDSPAGIRAALAAGLGVAAVPDAFTAAGVRQLVEGGALGAAAVGEQGALWAAIERAASVSGER